MTNQGSVCIIARTYTESNTQYNKPASTAICWVIFPPPVENHILRFALGAHLFSKMIQQTHSRHIHKALYCMLFVMFESFRELITLTHRDERCNILYGVHLRLEREAKRPIYSEMPPLFPELQSIFFLPCNSQATIMHHIMHNTGSEHSRS